MRRAIPALFLAASVAACAPPQPLISSFAATTPKEPIEGTVYNLPLAMLQVAIDTSKGVFTATPLHYPDPNATYLLNAQFGPASTDDFDLATSNQLLTSINATVTDNAPTIVTSVIEGIQRAAFGGRVLETSATDFKGTILVDPYKTRTGVIRVTAADPSIFTRVGQPRDRCPAGSSVCIPMLTPVTVHYTAPSGFRASALAMVPDPTRVIGIDLRQTACAQTTNALTFKNGIMTRYDVTRPSAVASCLSIPLEIIGAIFAAPIKALERESAILSEETALVEAQTKLLNAQIKLAQAQAQQQAPAAASE